MCTQKLDFHISARWTVGSAVQAFKLRIGHLGAVIKAEEDGELSELGDLSSPADIRFGPHIFGLQDPLPSAAGGGLGQYSGPLLDLQQFDIGGRPNLLPSPAAREPMFRHRFHLSGCWGFERTGMLNQQGQDRRFDLMHSHSRTLALQKNSVNMVDWKYNSFFPFNGKGTEHECTNR